MGGAKYFKDQFQIQKFKLECGDCSDFYLGCFQKNRSCIPLLLIRAILFFGSLAIVIASLVIQIQADVGDYWLVYLTHWGILLMMIACGFGFAVSLRAYFGGPIDATFGLPWYIVTYWILYNIATPIALFITLFYWAILYPIIKNNDDEAAELDLALDPVLDIFIHAINSVVMVILLLTSRHPSHILHFYFPFFFGVLYMVFSIIYYIVGGTDPYGNLYVYPVLDWSEPGAATITIAVCSILIILIHALVSALMLARNSLGKLYRKDQSLEISNGFP
ncbi:protein rolling stone-like [Leptidea sinapis]|uniref:protein rolling stone-like n=1 Tax=Leptidea sinapis TaxID=189913 RepID=UPI002133444B|nr:protein rolling stone-like [Leptidea sinapis]